MSMLLRVIVRAYGDEPVLLWVLKKNGDRVMVTNQEKTTTLSFPARSVFTFNDETLKRLKKAYKDNNLDQLSKIWDSVEAFV